MFACGWASSSARLTCPGIEGGPHHAVCDLATKIVEDLVQRALHLSPPTSAEQENSRIRELLRDAQAALLQQSACPEWCGQELADSRIMVCRSCFPKSGARGLVEFLDGDSRRGKGTATSRTPAEHEPAAGSEVASAAGGGLSVDATGIDTAWPLRSVLNVLANAADHLLGAHGCDDHGHEETREAVTAARRFLAPAAPPVGDLPAAAPAPPAKRTCNRHVDCDAADARAKAAGQHWADHCNDDCCEDCFGS